MTINRVSKVACGVALLLLAITATLRVLAHTIGDGSELASPFAALVEAIAAGTFTIVAMVLVLKRPQNPIGWLLLFPVDIFNAYAEYTLVANPDSRLPGGVIAGAADFAMWTPLVAVVLLVLLLFPGGRFSSRWWRAIGWFAVGGAALSFAHTLLSLEELDEPFAGQENPLAVLPSLDAVFGFGVVFPMMALVPVAAFALFRRFRRSRGEERQQFRWLAFSGALIVAYFPLYILLGSVSDEIAYALFTVTLMSLPVSIGIAVLKYRLYEIDRLVSRTLVYGVLTALLAATYFGLVVGLQALLRPMSGGSDLAIVVTTLVVAALFLPARQRIQRVVDRRFNRHAYDATRTIEAFSARLREQIDLDTLRYELLGVVDETMQPVRASLWLRAIPEDGRGDVAFR